MALQRDKLAPPIEIMQFVSLKALARSPGVGQTGRLILHPISRGLGGGFINLDPGL